MNLILFIPATEYSLRRIKLDKIVVFRKLAALCISEVPHERTNAATEAVVAALYSCRLIAAITLFVTLCFSLITMPKSNLSLEKKEY
jgi:hypothetical protein